MMRRMTREKEMLVKNPQLAAFRRIRRLQE
jgi:hypothetical protein